MNFEEGDRVPIWDYLDNRGIFEHFNPTEESYDTGMISVYHQLGIDLCRGYGGSFKEADEGTTTSDGATSHKISGKTRWETEHAIKSIDDLRKYKPEPVSEKYIYEEWVPSVKKQQELFAPYTMYVPGAGCGFHNTYGIMGLELFSYAIYDAYDDVKRILDIFNRNGIEMAKAAVKEKLCPLFFIGDDIAYKQRLMFPPDFLRKTFIVALKNMCKILKEGGIKVIFHSDGNVMEILDDMISAGINGLNPIEPIAGMDIGYLKRKYYRKLILVGNVDCSQILPLGTREEVIEASKECIRQASKGGGHFIGSSSEITPSTPVGNIIAFYETCREYGKYPIAI